MGHMEEVIEYEEPDVNHYIPHHCVFRPESNSTPLRVVYNASALTSSGKSLNFIQFNGGTIQDDLLSIMLRFRKHKFAFVADIKKMYRMVLIDPNKKYLLRILFKAGVNDPVKVYKLYTVTYGTTSAPFLATSVPRWILSEQSISVELHGFADASEQACGVVIYVKSINSYDDSVVKLRINKSRIAPLKFMTIPRLELCAAVLLSNLMRRVLRTL
ncbi:hypothetical protein AVEN_91229-1 [Araneus ventricosus]|uniref:Reverse transcriptase domain-containing protein n=1 Tax=Araneus ventricosus TaxID=182803 RepID=A0A4Y2VYI2_ARAVE|nr:hypothetical protein AVEN_91229-1 [Araneus ventricosus]